MAGVDNAALVGRPEEGLKFDQYSFVFLKSHVLDIPVSCSNGLMLISPLTDVRLGMSRQSGTPQAVLLAPLGHLVRGAWLYDICLEMNILVGF